MNECDLCKDEDWKDEGKFYLQIADIKGSICDI